MRPPLRRVLGRALRWRCPHCGQGPIFGGWLNKVLPRCPHCGLSYFREAGYYVGGMIITYLLTIILVVAVYLLTLLLPDVTYLSENVKFGLWLGFGALVAVLLVRHSYSLWLALDFWIEPWEPEALERAGGQRYRLS